MERDSYSRRILVCVTGLSPQVVTETIYALAHQNPPWIPTEVHILTTVAGAQRARLMLLSQDRNQFGLLVRDHGLEGIQFDDQNIHVIEDAEGWPLEDIRTQRDNLAVADGILRFIARLSQDEDCSIHVSLAGGRKSMGFFAGYALSLCARPQDRLSHVLVSQGFESNPEFFFPPREPRVLLTRDQEPISTADAKIELAEIPFVRLRDRVPGSLSEHGHFIKAIEAAQRISEKPQLRILVSERAIECAGERIDLTALRFGVFAWHAWRRLERTDPSVVLAEFDEVDSSLRKELHAFGNRLFENSFSLSHEDWNRRNWTQDALDHSQWLSEQRSRINACIRDAMGDEGGRVYGIKTVQLSGRSSAHRLDLPEDCIEIIW